MSLKIKLMSFILILLSVLSHADTNILVIGSTHSYSEGNESGVVTKKHVEGLIKLREETKKKRVM